jgi:hypothetical protein
VEGPLVDLLLHKTSTGITRVLLATKKVSSATDVYAFIFVRRRVDIKMLVFVSSNFVRACSVNPQSEGIGGHFGIQSPTSQNSPQSPSILSNSLGLGTEFEKIYISDQRCALYLLSL